MAQELARKRRKIPESEFKDGVDGLKYYDLTVGAGAEPKNGDRVAIHFGETMALWVCWHDGGSGQTWTSVLAVLARLFAVMACSC